MEEDPQRSLSIQELFKGKGVLVTGATGFLGKVLVEKLLRSCSGIRELFILLRPTGKEDVEKRLQDFLEHRVFDRLRLERSDALLQVRSLTGDIAADNLGLSEWDLKKVTSGVSFVFHCAANVRFDDNPRDTFTANLLGVKNVLDVCKQCENLEALVHVSTAFSFCNHSEISEQLYPELVKPQNFIELLKWMTDEQLRAMSMHYVQGRPSLYHFSKALAETYLAESCSTVPAIIVRPSIVTASVNEPFPGWIDNYNGPSGFIAVCGKGVVKTLLVKPNVNADWVPVDIVANTLIVAAHYIAVKSKMGNPAVELNSPSGIPIINCTCPNDNLITWMEVIKVCLPFLVQYPSKEVYGKPGGTVTPSNFRYAMCRLISHYIPAFILDCGSLFMGLKPKKVSMYKRIHHVMGHLEHFTTHPFLFNSSNMRKLVEQMDAEDRKIFHIDQGVLNWTQYMENYVLGVRRYFLKENDETIPEARVQMMRMHYLWLTLKISSLLGIFLMLRFLHGRSKKNFRSSLLPYFPVFSAIAFLRRKFTLFKATNLS